MDRESIKRQLAEFIDGQDSPHSVIFNRLLILAIVSNVILLTLYSVASVRAEYGHAILVAELFFTIAFTVEYFLRVFASQSAKRYCFSFYGLIDFIAIFPFYLSLFYPPLFYLANTHFLRIVRIFRVLKLMRFLGGFDLLIQAFYRCKQRIAVFLMTIFIICIVAATLMFTIEGPSNGFTDIPTSIYWSLVTVTTVGYGDIVPHSMLGRFVAVFLMVMGYGIIAVTTGIFTVELADLIKKKQSRQRCSHCHRGGHEQDAVFCKYCGDRMP